MDDLEGLDQYALIDLHAPLAHVNESPSPAKGDINVEGDQRKGKTPGCTVDKQEGKDSEHRTTMGGEKKRGEKREREETESPDPEEHLWAYSIEEPSKKRVNIQVTFEVSQELRETGVTEAILSVGQGIYDGPLDVWRSSQDIKGKVEFMEVWDKA